MNKRRGLCYNSCNRDLTSFFVTGLCGQPGGSVPSPNGFKSTLSRQAASGSWEVWRSVGWVHPPAGKHCLRQRLKSAHRDRPSVNRCSVCLILVIHPPHYWLVSVSASPSPLQPPPLNFLMSSISAISLDLKESSTSSIAEVFAVQLWGRENLKTLVLKPNVRSAHSLFSLNTIIPNRITLWC